MARRELTVQEREAVAEIAAACALVGNVVELLGQARVRRAGVIRAHRGLVEAVGPTRVAAEVGGCVSEGTIRAVLKRGGVG